MCVCCVCVCVSCVCVCVRVRVCGFSPLFLKFVVLLWAIASLFFLSFLFFVVVAVCFCFCFCCCCCCCCCWVVVGLLLGCCCCYCVMVVLVVVELFWGLFRVRSASSRDLILSWWEGIKNQQSENDKETRTTMLIKKLKRVKRQKLLSQYVDQHADSQTHRNQDSSSLIVLCSMSIKNTKSQTHRK